MMAAQSPRLPLATGISRLSISARLVLLSSILLLILAGTSLYLSSKLEQNAEALRAEAHYVEVLHTASAAEKAFGDLKYWLTDLAVSLLNLSEQRANEAKHELDEQLTALEPYDPASDRRHPQGPRRTHDPGAGGGRCLYRRPARDRQLPDGGGAGPYLRHRPAAVAARRQAERPGRKRQRGGAAQLDPGRQYVLDHPGHGRSTAR